MNGDALTARLGAKRPFSRVLAPTAGLAPDPGRTEPRPAEPEKSRPCADFVEKSTVGVLM